MIFKIFSTFTGAGGLDIGFHGDFYFLNQYFPKLKFQTKYAIEINRDACITLKQNPKYFNNTNIIEDDINNIDLSNLCNEKFDVLLGGFPCVTFSTVGKQIGIKDDLNGKLYEKFVHFVEVLQPKIFLAENVKGILSANQGEAIKIITQRFQQTGYKMKIKLINFADFGVPQLRERVIFIGVREDINREFIFPNPTHQKNHITAEIAFQKIDQSCINNNFMKESISTKEKLKSIPEGGNFKDLPSHLAVKGLMSNIYRKLDRNKPSYTLLASGGGGTWTYHYEEPRALTNRERARLQSFPDDFKFFGNNTEVRRQIGNAVPPVGIYCIAKEIEDILQSNFVCCLSKKIT